jgi:hypothetical protein
MAGTAGRKKESASSITSIVGRGLMHVKRWGDSFLFVVFITDMGVYSEVY